MEEKKMNDFNERSAERMISGIATAAIVAFGIIAAGTAALPVVLAYLYGWQWMLAYPCCLAVCSLLAGRKKKH